MPDDLQIRENIRLQKRMWKVQPIIWSLMLLFVVAGFFGLFGGAGPLNKTTAQGPSFRVEYQRFPTKSIPSTVTVEVDPEAISNGEAKLWLTSEYINHMVLTHVYPLPSKTEARDGGTLFTFSATDGQKATVLLVFEPTTSGPATSAYRVEGGGAVEVSHFIYP